MRLLSPRQNDTLKPLVVIALPVMMTNMVETLYNLTDTWFLGRLGPEELAAPSISFNLVMLIILLGNGLASAGTTLIARSVGQNNREKVDFYLGQMTMFLLLSSLIMGAVGYFFSGTFLSLIHTPENMIGMTRNYIEIISLGVPFMYGFFILQAAMQGTGNTMVALRIQLTATAVNIPLDALLIFGSGPLPGMGVEGAAIATVVSRGIACFSGIIILVRGNRGMKLKKKNLPFRRDAVSLFLRLGLPAALSHAGSTLGFTVMHGIVNTFGTAVIAAFGIVNRVHSIFYMPIQGLAKGVTTVVGQSSGSKRRESGGKGYFHRNPAGFSSNNPRNDSDLFLRREFYPFLSGFPRSHSRRNKAFPDNIAIGGHFCYLYDIRRGLSGSRGYPFHYDHAPRAALGYPPACSLASGGPPGSGGSGCLVCHVYFQYADYPDRVSAL